MLTKKAVLGLVIWLLLMSAGYWLLRGATISSDLTQFMPAGATPQQHMAVQLLREGPASRLILISLHDASTAELAQLSKEFAILLRSSGFFTQINNGAAVSEDDMASIFRYRYLLQPLTSGDAFSAKALHQALQLRLEELSSPFSMLERKHLARDPTAAMRAVMQSWKMQALPHSREGVWFTADGHEALLIAVMASPGFDAQAQKTAIEAIYEAFSATHPRQGARLELSGSPVFANAARASIKTDMQLLSTLGSGMIILFLFVSFRSARLVLLSALPLLTALVVGSTATVLVFGGLHGITLAFGITLLGVAIDYPIHLFSHLRNSVSATEAMRHIWPTLRLGVITTCIGYLAFARRDFEGLAQLGVFTVCGLLAAALLTRWLLPLLIGTVPGHTHWQMLRLHWFDLPRWWAGTLIALALIGLFAMFTLSPPVWEGEISALSPISASARILDMRLRSELGAADMSQLIVVKADTLEEVLANSERVAKQLQRALEDQRLASFDYAARYLPSAAMQRQRQQFLPDAESARQQLTAAMEILPFKPHGFDSFLRDVEASRQLAPLTLKDIQGTLLEARVAPLLFQDSGGWNSIITLNQIADANTFRTWWERQSELPAQYIDLKQVSTSMLIDFRDSAMQRLLFGIAAIWLTLSFGLHSLRQATLVLIPILVATALCAGLLGVLGERLSLFHLIAMLLTTGIGIDYSLFFQRSNNDSEDRFANHYAVLVCAVSTLSIFGILALSPIPVLRSIGLTVSLGVPLCFILALATARFRLVRV